MEILNERKGRSPEIVHSFVFALGFKISGLRPSWVFVVVYYED
jgi:hypothetical protein